MDTLFGHEIVPRNPVPLTESVSPGGTQDRFLQALFGAGMSANGDGFGQLNGLNPYLNQLNPDTSKTMLPAVQQSWQPWNAGTMYMADWLGKGGGKVSQQDQTARSNIQQYGGIGGWPTELMHNQAQFGGTGGPGHQAQSNLMQFGVPSAAGQPMADIARSGGSGTWGSALQQMASGGNNPAAQYLLPFLMAKPYSSRV